jgi:hypothetical protein
MDAPTQPAAYANQEQKPRYTKAEKRKYKAEHKTARVTQTAQTQLPQGKRHGQNVQKRNNRERNTRAGPGGANPSDFKHLSPTELDATIAQLLILRTQKGNKPLENRITREAPQQPPVKKELSPAKLEKIQKRREQRAAKKAEWVAKKAAEVIDAGRVPAAAPVLVPTYQPEPPTLVDEQSLPNDDEINWDE